MPPGYHGGENLWVVTFWLTVEEKTWDFRLLSGQFRIALCEFSMWLLLK